MGARYYDPEEAQFLSPDPYGYTGTTNLYAYANGDPINYYDPDGRLFQPALETIGVVKPGSIHDYGDISDYTNLRQSIAKSYESQYYGTQIPTWKDIAKKPWVPFYANWKAGQDLGNNPFVAGAPPLAAEIITGPAAKIGKLAKYAKSHPQLVKNIVNHRTALGSSKYSKFLAKNFYLDSGYSMSRARNHMLGIDFSRQVKKTQIKSGELRAQYQIPGNPQGNYYAFIHADKGRLGIYTSGVQKNVYKATWDVPVLQSYTADIIETYSMRNANWEILTVGGEIQEFTPLKNYFNLINP